MEVIYPFLIFSVSFFVTGLSLPVIIKLFTSRFRVLDVPGWRKIHKEAKPSMGGIAIFAGFLIPVLFSEHVRLLPNIQFWLLGLMLMFVIGLRDDIMDFRAIYKLLGQLTAAGVVVVLADIRLHGFYGLMWLGEIPVWASYIISVFTVVIIMNSFNLIDGLDGLAGSIGFVVIVTFGAWFYFIGHIAEAILCVGMSGAIGAFLRINWHPSKIFMGDTGSLTIGFFLATLAITFVHTASQLPDANFLALNSYISFAVSVLIVPLYDTLRIIIYRLSKGKSIFSADKSHIHHILLRIGMNHAQVTMILIAVNIFFILLALSIDRLGNNWGILIIALVAATLNIILDKVAKYKIANKEKLKKRTGA